MSPAPPEPLAGATPRRTAATEAGPLDSGWRHDVVERSADVRFPVDHLVAAYSCASGSGAAAHHHQVFHAGSLVAWEEGLPEHPDVHLAHTVDANLALLHRTGDGQHLASTTSLVVDGEERAVPPIDEAIVAWGGDLPSVGGVGEVVLLQIVVGTPFGTLRTWFRIDGGPVVESGVGLPSRDPDIVVQRAFSLALRERAGMMDVLDSLEGGGVHGDTGKLMMFLGGFDSPECRAARRTLATRADRGLVDLAAVLCSSQWAGLIDGPPGAGDP